MQGSSCVPAWSAPFFTERTGRTDPRFGALAGPLTECAAVFYIFDAIRQAVLLVGGDKTGNARFYMAMVPFAEAIWEQYQAEREQEKKP